MADELLQVLTRFHREVIAPDLDRRDERLGAVEQKLDEVLTHFDAICRRFDRLESLHTLARLDEVARVGVGGFPEGEKTLVAPAGVVAMA